MKRSYHFVFLFSFLQVLQTSSFDIKSKQIAILNEKNEKRENLRDKGMDIDRNSINRRELFYEDIGCMYGAAAALALAYIVISNSNGDIISVEFEDDAVIKLRDKLGILSYESNKEEIRERRKFFDQLEKASNIVEIKRRNRVRRGRLFLKKAENE